MIDGLRLAPEGRIYGIYGAIMFGMQTVERTLKAALIETIVALGRLTSQMKRSLVYVTLGNMVEKLESLVRPRFTDECDDLRSYIKNRNYVAHQFFQAYVDAVGDAARDDKAEAFLRFCLRDAVLALHRIAVMTRELRLPEYMAHAERMDLELMKNLKFESSERIAVRKLQDA